MPRVAVPITSLPVNAGTAPATGVSADPANGHVVQAGGDTSKLLVHVTNTAAAAKNVTVLAGGDPPAFRAGAGNLVVSVPATNGARYLVLESARFAQATGDIYIDLETGMTGTLTCYRLPKEV